ncbi:CRISPR-associated protein Cas1 [Desulfobotulus alkaliphilus]|uniref:CRISPR-associated endonuclease Cas1 n=1 Tax=Desulfobotulus alkaliphilus TaxID=622671 RepID=A0A562R9L6_9BACT|nr:CRISPR-associated endonuclease Cas1 [Desulfobotulus alkaliphilus]TWI65761.1 CRISPR-associated protein Cas1 [Desulfobotulus alkaliphilus]
MESHHVQNELVPARMVNEFVYCPRLAYLEWVQGEWRDNSDTEEGRHTHRKVDRPSGNLPEKGMEEEEKFHARSLTLSDGDLGLIAVLDLVEGEGREATPVDYKKGKRPHVEKGAWDPERVQLCAQGMLLEKHGYASEEGIIYFAGSRERVRIPFDPALKAQTLEAIAGLRALQALNSPPPPLEDSPKCPRCSLVPICMPDEVNWYANREESPRPIAVRDEEKVPLYVQAPYARIRKSGDELLVETEKEKKSVRIAEINHLALFGNASLTSPALTHLMQQGIPVSFHTQGGWFYGHANGLTGKNIHLRIQQYKTAFDPERALIISRSLVRAKVLNARTLLRRNWRNTMEPPEELLSKLRHQAMQTARAENLQTLLGIEGQAAALYFSAFSGMLREETGFSFENRNRRPPKDPVNALLSFGYSILTRTWLSTLQNVGFDPFLGFYHQPRANRPALALDMMEPFRPLLVDSAVITAINNNELQPEDFIRRAGYCALSPEGRKTFIRVLERRISQNITHPAFGYRLSYRRLLELEARLMGRWLTGEIQHYQGFVTR